MTVLDHYSYNDTYDISQGFYNNFIGTSTRVTTALACETIAFHNKSSAFILTDFSSTNMDASCLYFNSKQYTDASLNDWLSGIGKCSSIGDTCYDLSGSNYFGKDTNMSLYFSPVMSLVEQQKQMPVPDRAYFDEVYSSATNNLNTYTNNRNAYLYAYYLGVSGENNGKVTWASRNMKHSVESSEQTMNVSQEKLEADLFQLNNIYNDLIMMTAELDNNDSAALLDVLNKQILSGENDFNILMNKNQGAIGELDITEYNKSLAIFENIVISIAILSIIYVYFKTKSS